MSSRNAAILLAVIVVGGVVVRCHGLSERTFWFDEAFSNRLIHDFSWAEMIERTGRDVHPPLYYVALRLWATILGDGIIVLRTFSVVMAAMTIVGAYLLVFEAFAHGRDVPESGNRSGRDSFAPRVVSRSPRRPYLRVCSALGTCDTDCWAKHWMGLEAGARRLTVHDDSLQKR